VKQCAEEDPEAASLKQERCLAKHSVPLQLADENLGARLCTKRQKIVMFLPKIYVLKQELNYFSTLRTHSIPPISHRQASCSGALCFAKHYMNSEATSLEYKHVVFHKP
jgi:hypothetical protein